jgi:hypothetical protein
MLVLAYLYAVLRKWVASMSGIASLAVGAAIQWHWIQPATAADPRVWWGIAGACFATAMFQAWSDEYRRRIQLEGVGPRVVLEHRPMRDVLDQKHSQWFVVNHGEADAVNVELDPLAVGDMTATTDLVQRLKKGDSVQVEFRHRAGNSHFGTSPHIEYLIWELKDRLKTQFAGDAYLEALTDLRLPVRLTYYDASGVPFESAGRIHWNEMLEEGHVKPLSWRRRAPEPLWRRAVSRITSRRSA